jgi:hypothetical protein
MRWWRRALREGVVNAAVHAAAVEWAGRLSRHNGGRGGAAARELADALVATAARAHLRGRQLGWGERLATAELFQGKWEEGRVRLNRPVGDQPRVVVPWPPTHTYARGSAYDFFELENVEMAVSRKNDYRGVDTIRWWNVYPVRGEDRRRMAPRLLTKAISVVRRASWDIMELARVDRFMGVAMTVEREFRAIEEELTGCASEFGRGVMGWGPDDRPIFEHEERPGSRRESGREAPPWVR